MLPLNRFEIDVFVSPKLEGEGPGEVMQKFDHEVRVKHPTKAAIYHGGIPRNHNLLLRNLDDDKIFLHKYDHDWMICLGLILYLGHPRCICPSLQCMKKHTQIITRFPKTECKPHEGWPTKQNSKDEVNWPENHEGSPTTWSPPPQKTHIHSWRRDLQHIRFHWIHRNSWIWKKSFHSLHIKCFWGLIEAKKQIVIDLHLSMFFTGEDEIYFFQ